MPVSPGSAPKSFRQASRPPAEAPIPTTRNSRESRREPSAAKRRRRNRGRAALARCGRRSGIKLFPHMARFPTGSATHCYHSFATAGDSRAGSGAPAPAWVPLNCTRSGFCVLSEPTLVISRQLHFANQKFRLRCGRPRLRRNALLGVVPLRLSPRLQPGSSLLLPRFSSWPFLPGDRSDPEVSDRRPAYALAWGRRVGNDRRDQHSSIRRPSQAHDEDFLIRRKCAPPFLHT